MRSAPVRLADREACRCRGGGLESPLAVADNQPGPAAGQKRMTSNFHEVTSDICTFIRAEDPSEERFNQLALRLCSYQFQHNLAWRRFCEARDWTPRNVDDWRRIPAAPTAAFKELELTTLPPEQRAAVFHSSGTAAQSPSRHFHNLESLAVYETSSLAWFEPHLKLSDGSHPRLLFLTPSPALAPHSSLVHMFETIRRAYPDGDGRFIGGVDANGNWTICRGELGQALGDGRPAALFGAAFHFVHLLETPAAAALRINLPAGSRVLETGGYKGRSRSLTQDQLHALIAKRLGVRRDRIVCEYGMSELSSQAYDLALDPSRTTHHAPRLFRFPPWARVRIVSPETGREVADGETGLIRVYDLANVASVFAVQTEDLAIRRGDGFEFIGRAAAAEARGCSLMTA